MQREAQAAAAQTVELVERARHGDRDAYGELVELMWHQLVPLARAILAGDDEAEDVVQEAFVHGWKRLGSLRQPARFPAWIRRIVSRRCFAHLRRPRLPAGPLPEPRSAARSEPGPAGIDVERMLSRLPPRQRAVIFLTVVEGHSSREAATLLGILPATARVHRHRGMARLRRALKEWRK